MENREIKFRVWTGLNMEYDVIVGKLGAFYCKELDPKDSASLSPMNTIYSNEIQLMQYTGLKDKKNKEIFEGDIVKIIRKEQNPNTYDYDIVEKISFIEYRNNGFWVHDEDFGWEGEDLWDWEKMEVIGNIYENAELLK